MELLVFSDLAKAFLSFLLATVLLLTARRFGRSYISCWSWAWFAIGVHQLGEICASIARPLSASDPVRLLATTSYVLPGYLSAVWLTVGMYELAKGKIVKRSLRRKIEWLAVALALTIVFGSIAVDPVTRLFLRVGLRALILGTVMLVVSINLLRIGFWKRGLGRRLVIVLFTLTGLQQLHYAGVEIVWIFTREEPPWYFEYMGILSIACLAALGFGMLIWLLEDEWEHLRTTQEQLIQSQRLESVGQLAGGIAHDFNNLLQVILGNAAVAEVTEGEQRSTAIDAIRSSGLRAAELTSQLLAFSRRQPLTPVTTDLNALIAGLTKILRPVMTETIEVSVSSGTDLESVKIDPGQIEQVLINLCVNARDAMPNGGKLQVATRNVCIEQDESWAPAGKYVLLSVEDTGTGMDPATAKSALEPFFTTKEPGKGTGLGLPMASGIIEQHGGQLRILSEPGKGTRFEIYLPICGQPIPSADKLAASETTQSASLQGTETVLVAEDNPMVLDLTRSVLERAGYKVLQARDGTEAIALFKKQRNEIGLVLLDAVMPRLTGREVYERLRADGADVPVLFTSGYSENVLPAQFLRGNGLRVVPKPVEPTSLLREVRLALDA